MPELRTEAWKLRTEVPIPKKKMFAAIKSSMAAMISAIQADKRLVMKQIRANNIGITTA
jgi:hypothetical protein